MAPAEGDGVHQLSLGVMGRSRKENERRLPLHPQHLSRIPDDLRESIYLERDYGDRFGMSDDQLKGWVAGFRPASSSSRSATSSCNPSRYSVTSPRCASGRFSGGGRTACRTRNSRRSPST